MCSGIQDNKSQPRDLSKLRSCRGTAKNELVQNTLLLLSGLLVVERFSCEDMNTEPKRQ